MRERGRQRHAPFGRMVWGLFILGLGVAFLLDQMGNVELHDLWEWWPTLIIVGGIATLADRQLSGIIWIIIGGLLLAPRLGLGYLGLGEVLALWPLTIAAAGLALLVQGFRPAPKDLFGDRSRGFRAIAFMSGNAPAIGARDFLGGDAIAVMGGCDIDLRNAEIRGDEAVIDVLAFWGGISLRVPREWTVVSRVTPILGGMDDRTEGSTNGKRLIVRGSAIMGGVEVKH